MPWRPNMYARIHSTSFWQAIETTYDNSCSDDPLPRDEPEKLDSNYIRWRVGDETRDISARISRLPKSFRTINLGPTDIELLDFIINYKEERNLLLVGPCGAGKTTLLHFAEMALNRAIHDSPPVLLIINCLAVDSSARAPQLAGLLRDELKRRACMASQQYAHALRVAAEELDRDTTIEGAKRAASILIQLLPNSNHKKAIIAFDNLDQLSGHVIDSAVELAKQIYATSKLGSIVCLRPGSLGGVLARTQARAFFSYALEVPAPHVGAWLSRLHSRMTAYALSQAKDTGQLLEAHGLKLDFDLLNKAFNRFSKLLTGTKRRSEDDVIHLLEQFSADDTRLLRRLVRRILSNRNLPDRWLLELSESNDFHPLSALIEGHRELYQDDGGDFPNLLCFHYQGGEPDLLISHRILALLDSSQASQPVKAEFLLKCLEILGHERSKSIKCLAMLYRANLLGMADREILSEGLPEAYFLTRAGYFYLHFLLGYTDYLAAVVVDIPLEHHQLRQSSDLNFAARLSSLAELVEEVRLAEHRQIFAELPKQTPSHDLRHIANSLSKGSLLTASIVRGIKSAMERGRASQSSSVRERAEKLTPLIKKTERWLESAEKRLRELINRGRKHTSPIETDQKGSIGNAEYKLKYGEAGHVDIELNFVGGTNQALVALSGSHSNEVFSVATIALPKMHKLSKETGSRSTLETRIGNVLQRDLSEKHVESMQVIPIPRNLERSALFCAEEISGRTLLSLYACNGRAACEELGSIDSNRLRDWSSNALSRMNELVLSGKPFTERIRALGADLGHLVLAEKGQNRLASYYELIDTAFIFSKEIHIPWEWLLPPMRKKDEVGYNKLRCLGEQWRTIRWHADPKQGMLLLNLADQSAPIGKLETVGGDQKTVKCMKELQEIAASADTLHLIGHYSADGIVMSQDFTIDVALIRAFPLPRVKNIIVSACEGAIIPGDNVPLELANFSQCVVWTPLVSIREVDALVIDGELRREAQATSLDAFMNTRRSKLPLTSLYVRYGLHS